MGSGLKFLGWTISRLACVGIVSLMAGGASAQDVDFTLEDIKSLAAAYEMAQSGNFKAAVEAYGRIQADQSKSSALQSAALEGLIYVKMQIYLKAVDKVGRTKARDDVLVLIDFAAQYKQHAIAVDYMEAVVLSDGPLSAQTFGTLPIAAEMARLEARLPTEAEVAAAIEEASQPSPEPQPSGTPTEDRICDAKGSCNVRRSADKNSKLIGTILRGETVTVEVGPPKAGEEEWFRIVNDGGYINRGIVKPKD